MSTGGGSFPPVVIPIPTPAGLGYGGMALAAMGQITVSGVGAGDGVDINGVSLTASGSQTPGGQDFDETLGTDELVAQSLADAINDAGNGLTALVGAGTSGSNIVTVIAQTAGVVGNNITLGTNNPTTLAISGSTLEGGSDSGAAYGYSPYGSMPFPRPPYPPGGGYGGAAYGQNPYGSTEQIPPRVSGVVSLNGTQIEVFFTEQMDSTDSNIFCNPDNYTITGIIGVPTVDVLLVEIGTTGPQGYATSAILTHTGTTLGGNYEVECFNITDLAGNPIDTLPTNKGRALTFGDTPTYTVTPIGSSLRVQFSEDMAPETVFSPGIEEIAAYGITTTYPIPLTVTGVTHPVGGDDSVVDLAVEGMTSAEYDIEIAPSDAVVYDGTVLPDADPGFAGSEIGSGSSVISAGKLTLSKSLGTFYGWEFGDTSGRVLPSSTFRMDVVIDASSATISPPLTTTAFGTVSVSDGAVQVDFTLTRTAGPIDVIEVDSGAFSMTVPFDWSGSEFKLTLLRNQLSDHYAVLINDVPVLADLTASFTGVPSISAGARVQLNPAYAVSGFTIDSLVMTSTQTVFSAVWNFLHGVSSTFTGGTAVTRDRLQTERGPLVKGWGDATPATTQDVEVRINGVPVPLASVNPYMGEVFPEVPIPLTPPGTATVEVDYQWFPSPIMTMGTLNTTGLILNKYDQPTGHHTPPASPTPSTSTGSPDTHRFPMGVVLGPQERRQPIHIGHRYLGFEKAYTAALNSPTTLLLNQAPNRPNKPGFERSPEPVSVLYDGSVDPPNATDAWVLTGQDAGEVNEAGTAYIVIDDSSGSYEVGFAALYVREEDLSFPSTVNMSVRTRMDEWEPDGVFTGGAFGTHDNHRLYMVGFVEINDVKHLGFLLNPSRPDLAESWQLGPPTPIMITSSTTFEVDTDDVPSFIGDGDRFQIIDGSQAGVYTIAECGIENNDDGTTTITIEEEFPADPGEYGNNDPTIIFETQWDERLTTYRLIADPDSQNAQVFIGGTVDTPAIEITGAPGIPARTSLLLPTGEKGALFWGSASRLATNTSEWTFVQYTIQPDATSFFSTGIVVAAEMSDAPDEDANNPWFLTNEFGQGYIDSSGDTLLLKSTSESPDGSTDLTFGYARIEPFLTPEVAIDLDATFRMDSGVLGAGDTEIIIRDGERETRLATILYVEGGTPFRQLVSPPVESISGLRDPVGEGWDQPTTFDIASSVRQNKITVTQEVGETGFWRKELSGTLSNTGRVAESTFRVNSYTPDGSGFVGPLFATNAGPSGTTRRVGLTLMDGPQRVALVDNSLTVITTFPFTWDDGEFHTFRMTVQPSANTVTVVADDTLIGTATYNAFATVSTSNRRILFGTGGSTTASEVEWDAFSVHALPPSSAKRTIGVFLGGDDTDIDNWELPRTDSSTVPNSESGALVEEMDWESDISLRIRKDPGWGVTVFRPDLPLPPYYDPDGWATALTNPSEGWINVEARDLPRVETMFGMVRFGALDPRSVSQQRWGEVRYRIYTALTEDLSQPSNMVLNRFNVINSGEYNVDVTPEVVTVMSLTSTLITLKASHIYGDRIFNVVVDDAVIPSTAWTFDETSQTITITDSAYELPADHYPVTVTFAPGKPVTNTYLCSQPLEASVTLLNEGTPPVPLSQQSETIREEVFGSKINDPDDVLNTDPDFILNDPYRTVEFTDGPESLYECMEFCTVDDDNETGLLSIACDGPAPESGWIEMALEGIGFTDCWTRPGGPAVHKGSPVLGETAGPFAHESILHVSGGSYVDGVLGPGSAVLYRNRTGPGYRTGTDQAVLNREIEMALRLESVTTSGGDTPLEDTLGAIGDNVPPSAVSGDAVPDGTPGATGNGAAAAETSDVGPSNSVLGPWAGLAALQTQSLLAGGQQLDGSELILNTPKSEPTVSSFQIEAAN